MFRPDLAGIPLRAGQAENPLSVPESQKITREITTRNILNGGKAIPGLCGYRANKLFNRATIFFGWTEFEKPNHSVASGQ